jgi:hypothetical protein
MIVLIATNSKQEVLVVQAAPEVPVDQVQIVETVVIVKVEFVE